MSDLDMFSAQKSLSIQKISACGGQKIDPVTLHSEVTNPIPPPTTTMRNVVTSVTALMLGHAKLKLMSAHTTKGG